MASLQVSLLGGSRDETWHGQGIRKRSVFWNLPNIESVVTVQRRFRTMYHTEPPTDKTTLEWYMKCMYNVQCYACALRNEQAGRGHRPRLSSVCEKRMSGALRSQHIARAGNCRCLSQVCGAFCANVFA